jgi:hypothetical protein
MGRDEDVQRFDMTGSININVIAVWWWSAKKVQTREEIKPQVEFPKCVYGCI